MEKSHLNTPTKVQLILSSLTPENQSQNHVMAELWQDVDSILGSWATNRLRRRFVKV